MTERSRYLNGCLARFLVGEVFGEKDFGHGLARHRSGLLNLIEETHIG